MVKVAFKRAHELNETRPVYVHEASGVKIRKAVIRGEVQYNIYIPDEAPPVDGAWTLQEAKRKAIVHVLRIMDVGEDV